MTPENSRSGTTPANDLMDDASFLLARANVLSQAAANAALAPFDLKVRAYSVLALAAAAEHPSQRELAEFLRLDPSQVVALVDDLQTRGFVVREPDESDRRANVVSITSSGRSLFERARAATRSAENEVQAALTADERARLTEILQRLAFPS